MISRAAEITPKEGQTAAETPIKTQIQARMKTAKATVIPGQIIAAANQAKSKPKSNKFWNFVARNSETDAPAELILYGDISSDNSWYDDEITPKQFDKELKELGDVDEITVRINSGGGDVFAANAIYTRLKDHKAKINVKIDGWAASAATIIAMSGDTIQIPASGVFMIHNPKMGVLGYYSAAEFDKLSAELAVIKQSIINAYCLKTGKKSEEISDLMDCETWYDGKQAVDSGFCTELMFNDDVTTEVEDATHIIVNSVQMSLKDYKNLPQTLKTKRKNAADLSQTAANMVFDCHNNDSFANTHQNQENPQNKGGFKEMEIKTVEELEAKYPDLVAQVRNAAITAERKRIQDIESVAPKGYEKITNAAKFEKPVNNGEFAMMILAEQKKQAADIAAKTDADVEDSGIKDVKPISNESENGAGGDINPFMTAIDKVLPARKEG